MRAIKFRVWDHFNKQFVTHYDKENGSEISVTFDGSLIISSRDGYYDLEQKRYAVNQFTGLLDKNGREIYEGDILIDPKTKQTFTVNWTDWKGMIMFVSADFVADLTQIDPESELEIVGNIFETKL